MTCTRKHRMTYELRYKTKYKILDPENLKNKHITACIMDMKGHRSGTDTAVTASDGSATPTAPSAHDTNTNINMDTHTHSQLSKTKTLRSLQFKKKIRAFEAKLK